MLHKNRISATAQNFMGARTIILKFLTVMGAGLLITGTAFADDQNQSNTSQTPSGDLVVPVKKYPWSAIGKLNNGVFGSCTGVLISQNYALTAAHCLFYRTVNRFLPSASLHFILGYESERFADHLRVLAYYVPRSYDPLKPFETIANDWALLLVSSEQRSAVRPLAIAQNINPSSGLGVMTAGFSGLTPHRMTADQRCRFVGRSGDSGLLFDNCHAPQGFSGGPVLIENPDKQSYSVAGIHVGNQAWQGRPVAIAISAETIWREIKPCVVDQECHFEHQASGREPSAAEILSGLPNLGVKPRIGSLPESPCNNSDPVCGKATADR